MGQLCALTFADRLAISTGSKAEGMVWWINPLKVYTRSEQRTFLAWAAVSPAGNDELANTTCAVLVVPGSPAPRPLARGQQFHRVAQDRRAELWGRSACERSR